MISCFPEPKRKQNSQEAVHWLALFLQNSLIFSLLFQCKSPSIKYIKTFLKHTFMIIHENVNPCIDPPHKSLIFLESALVLCIRHTLLWHLAHQYCLPEKALQLPTFESNTPTLPPTQSNSASCIATCLCRRKHTLSLVLMLHKEEDGKDSIYLRRW